MLNFITKPLQKIKNFDILLAVCYQGIFLLKGFMTLAVIGWYSTGVWRLMNAYFNNNFKDHMEEQLLKDPHRLKRLKREPLQPNLQRAAEAPADSHVLDVTKLPPLSELDPEEYEIKVVRKRKVKKPSFDIDLDEEVCTLDHAPSATGEMEGKGGCGPGNP
jgi:hypothetical protein